MTASVLTIAAALQQAAQLQACSDTPELDLQLLLAAVLEKPRSYLYTWPERQLTTAQQQQLASWLARRASGEPVAHILGWQGFWSLELEVNSCTLIPRPETELLVELALELLPEAGVRAADLGTGTGAIALALAHERPQWQLQAVDRIADAAALAERNRQRLGLPNVEVLCGSWCEPLSGSFQLIVSNPPYIDPADPHLQQGDVRFEPRSALVAERGGLADIEQIAAQSRVLLRGGGWLLLEHGYDQGAAVRRVLTGNGYRRVETRTDLERRDRVTLGFYGGADGDE